MFQVLFPALHPVRIQVLLLVINVLCDYNIRAQRCSKCCSTCCSTCCSKHVRIQVLLLVQVLHWIHLLLQHQSKALLQMLSQMLFPSAAPSTVPSTVPPTVLRAVSCTAPSPDPSTSIASTTDLVNFGSL